MRVAHARFPHSIVLPRGWVRSELEGGESAPDRSGFIAISAAVVLADLCVFVVCAREAVAGSSARGLLETIAQNEGFTLVELRAEPDARGDAVRASAHQGANRAEIALRIVEGIAWALTVLGPAEVVARHAADTAELFASFHPQPRRAFDVPKPEARPRKPPAVIPPTRGDLPAEWVLREPVRTMRPVAERGRVARLVRTKPDASHFAFVVEGGERAGLWTGYDRTDRSNVQIGEPVAAPVSDLAWSPRGTHLACLHADGTLRAIDVRGRACGLAVTAKVWGWQPDHPARSLGLVTLDREVLWFVIEAPTRLCRWCSDLGTVEEIATIDPAEFCAPAPDGNEVAIVQTTPEATLVTLLATATGARREALRFPPETRVHATWHPGGGSLLLATAATATTPGLLVVLDSVTGVVRTLAERATTRVGVGALWLPSGEQVAFFRDDADGARLHGLTLGTSAEFATGFVVRGTGELRLLPNDRIAYEDGTSAIVSWFRGPLGIPREERDDGELPFTGLAPVGAERAAWATVDLPAAAASIELPVAWIENPPRDASAPGGFVRVAEFSPPAPNPTGAKITLWRRTVPSEGAIVGVLTAAHAELGMDERMARDHDGRLDTLGTSQRTATFRRLRTLLLEDGGELWLLVADVDDDAWHELQGTLSHALLSFTLLAPRGATVVLDRDPEAPRRYCPA